jgi:putative transposase
MEHAKRLSHKVTMNFWHFEWCTKYRYKMMQSLEIKNLVQAAIRKAAHEYGIVFRVLKILPEHVHALATLPNGMTDSKALALLKGRSSYLIFRNREHITLRYPKRHFWSPSNYSATVGMTDLEACESYINNQEKHHQVAFN